MKILTVVGARPQFIKVSPVSRALKSAGHNEILLHTGQHYDHSMSQVFFDELEIQAPESNLEIGSGSHGEMTAGMLIGIERAIILHEPDWVLIYGDTNSTLAGALAAVKLHVPVAHVEAGLRSFNRQMPEEINRIVADSVSDMLFAPTTEAMTNLWHENIPAERVHMVGDVMYDAALIHGEKAEKESKILDILGLKTDGFVLSTVHRAENTDDLGRIRAIIEGLKLVAEEIPVVLPLHPRTHGALERSGLLESARESLKLIEPVGYLDMVKLEKNAALIATDSGGVQKEAFFQKVPCVTLRDETEWVELVNMGWNRLCPPTSAEAIAKEVRSMIGVVGRDENPYGAGDASEKIARVLSSNLT
ncbi:MAG: UDP-N-acetylglucosamine 2-epimerase (non-hydrolyzing) [Armatimonadota bacterium]|nr:UDP-N-acetylglucosamine 2-epimerase (non-hydrolyzing) [bacterium]